MLRRTESSGVVTCTGGTLDGNSDLVPGAGNTRLIKIVVTAPDANGPITNHVVIDPNNAIGESNETNNMTFTILQLNGDNTVKVIQQGPHA